MWLVRLVRTFAFLSVVLVVRGQDLFTDTVPKDYYLRKDLSDCSARFHPPKYYGSQCLIFGGQQVNVTDFPHMAVLGWKTLDVDGSDTGVRWMCGGFLITERFVLTAAHCESDSNNVPPHWVRLGDVNLETSEGDEHAQQFEILRFVRHPEHRFSRKYFDMALVELNGYVKLTPAVCPACLWSKSVLPYDEFDTAGYGETHFGGGPVPTLLKTVLHAVNSTQCRAWFKNTRGLHDGVAEDQMCAMNVMADSCQGDSGGPLQVSLRTLLNEHPFVVALTSFGRGCGLGSYGVYQLLAPHIPWMESIVNETLDAGHCTSKYQQFRKYTSLLSECSLTNVHTSRVDLLWPEGSKKPAAPCSGTIIDYNTVVTSVTCSKNMDGIQPNAIDVLGTRAKIVEIQVHPDYSESSHENDLALLRLDKYLNPDQYVAPSCIPLPRSSEICTDQQTYNPVACWDQFAQQTKTHLLNSLCTPQSILRSTVRLVWPKQDGDQPTCEGMIIKPDTVITSIRCMNNHGGDPPVAIEFDDTELQRRVKIVKILRHPGHGMKGPERDTALLLLDTNTNDTTSFVPKCIANMDDNQNSWTQVSVHGIYRSGIIPGHIYLRTKNSCHDSMMERFQQKVGGNAANLSRYTCWDSEQHVAPDMVPLEQGAGLLDPTHRFIRGVSSQFTGSFGSFEPLISMNLTAYADWIAQFVLYRPPREEVVFRDGDDEFDYGSKCTLKNGTGGNCIPEYGCTKQIQLHKNSNEITICGFQGDISYICCPAGHQDLPLLAEIDLPVIREISLLPSLPYENRGHSSPSKRRISLIPIFND